MKPILTSLCVAAALSAGVLAGLSMSQPSAIQPVASDEAMSVFGAAPCYTKLGTDAGCEGSCIDITDVIQDTQQGNKDNRKLNCSGMSGCGQYNETSNGCVGQ